MAQDSRFADYLALKKGAPIGHGDLPSLFVGNKGARAGTCVDWVKIDNQLAMIVARPGETMKVARIPLRFEDVARSVTLRLSAAQYLTALRDEPDLLREMDALIAPLAELTRPQELLILCPTLSLHAIPLHALELDGEPLIARNPVCYSFSLGVTRHAVLRRAAASPSVRFAIFGDPASGEPRAEARKIAENLAARFGGTPFVGEGATKDAFITALTKARSVHFQGHAIFETNATKGALKSHLIFAGKNVHLTAREILEKIKIEAEHITLGACESAANKLRAGDEPLGLIPALQLAGARSVVAALWPVREIPHQSS